MKKAKHEETHASYGMALFTRRSSNKGVVLFGSQIKHTETITLTISLATLRRNLEQFWYYGNDELIEVEMSPVQFAELLTTMNIGSGVPVTIRHVGGKHAGEPPYTSERELIQQEYSDVVANVADRFKNCMSRIKDIVSKGTATRAEIKALALEMDVFQDHLNKNLPFVHAQFDEAMEKTVVQAKGEIEAFWTSTVHRLGFEALQNEGRKLLKPTLLDEDK